MIGALGAISLVSLAACGTSSDATSVPTETATVSASDLSVTATVVTANMAVTAPTDTPAPAAAMDTAPTQSSSNTTDPAATAPAGAGQVSTGSAGAATQINATLKEWSIDLSQKEVPAGKVRFVVTNAGMMRHNLTVTDSSGAELGSTSNFDSSAGPQTFEVDLKAGTYTIICSLPGHASRGQKAELVVK